MRLFSKIALTLSATAIAGSIAAIAAVYLIFGPQYQQMDKLAAVDTGKRVYAAFQREFAVSSSRTADWGNWDDTFKFATDFNKAYQESNFGEGALSTISVTEFMIVDLSGEIKFHVAESSDAATSSIPFSHMKQFPSIIWKPKAELAPKARFSGLVSINDIPVIVSYSRITDSNYVKTSDKVIAMSRTLDKKFMDGVSEQAGVKFKLTPVNSSSFENAEKFAVDKVNSAFAYVWKESDGYRVLTPIQAPSGQAQYAVQLYTPATFAALGQRTLYLVATVLLLIGMIMGTVLVLFMSNVVTVPLHQLISFSKRLAKSNDLNLRTGIKRKDEIGELASAYDGMLGELKEAHARIQEMSYTSGMANTAADMLHNIRNTLTPMMTAIWKSRESLKSMKADMLMTAAKELSSAAPGSERFAKLTSYLQASAHNLAENTKGVESNLIAVQDFTGQIESVLRYHEEASRSDRLKEPVSYKDLIASAEKLIRSSSTLPIQIQFAGDLLELPPVLAERVVLRQIIENIVVNSIHSLESKKPETATITFAGQTDANTVALSITDNGVGIDEANIEKIFSRGMSTKGASGRGLGLHFCATNIKAMSGEISAHSDGAGSGATFQIKLPKWNSKEAVA